MKKLTIIITLLGITFLSSQAQSGYLLGGDVFFWGTSGDNSTPSTTAVGNTFGLTLQPSFGKMINQKYAAGVLLEYEYNLSRSENITPVSFSKNESIINGYGGGLFGRRYFDIGGTVKPILQISSIYSNSKENNFSNNNGIVNESQSNPLNSIESAIIPSVAFFFSPKFSLELSYGQFVHRARWENLDNGIVRKTGDFGFTTEAASFNFVYYFANK